MMRKIEGSREPHQLTETQQKLNINILNQSYQDLHQIDTHTSILSIKSLCSNIDLKIIRLFIYIYTVADKSFWPVRFSSIILTNKAVNK